jgi:pilus assembly protein FimV
MMRKKLHADRALEAQKVMRKPHRWKTTAFAAATAILLGMSSFDAQALALGRLTVQSALGEPLRAEIDIPDINAEEAASLKAGVASAEAFKAAGLDYNLTIGNMQIALMRRPDGRMYLRLSSERAVNDPFLDLILEANWSSGRIVRDYTLLFDPPALRQGAAPAPTAPQISALPTPRSAPSATPGYQPPAVAAAPAGRRAFAERPAPTARPQPAGGGKQLTVQAGDTAGRIAASNKPASVSLDQMLVALLRANPDAFINGNINRIKAGAVLDVPTADQASATSAGEATQTLVAQSKDFNEFRRKLAVGAPTKQIAQADRAAGGKVQARVEDKKPSAATPDKLTLSKGAIQAKANEEKIAKERAAKEASSRVAELSKNLSDLGRIGAASGATGTGAAASSGAAKGVNVPVGPLTAPTSVKAAPVAPAATMTAPMAAPMAAKPASAPAAMAAVPPAVKPASAPMVAPSPVAAPAPAPVAAASAAVPAMAMPVAPASAPAAPSTATPAIAAASAAAPAASTATMATQTASVATAPKPVVKAPAAPPPPEPTLMEELMDNPLIPGGVLLVLALLGGFGFYRIRQRRRSTQVDSSFLESRLQPDSFFGASGGQRIDTNEGGATGSSMVYSPSQLDAAGDVDPVAEADVYLAYGRDLQAEEILKEAMRTNPARVAIHGKLLEIYAKRRDGKAFEMVAAEAYALTRGEGPEWEHICELGRELDASNPMYQPGGQPAPRPGAPANAPMGTGFATSTIPQAIQPELEESAAPVDFDLDLDFSLGDEPPGARAVSPVAIEQTQAMKPVPQGPAPSLDMDFGGATVAMHNPPTTPSVTDTVKLSVPDQALSSSSLSFSPEPTPAAAKPVAAPVVDAGMIEFDLGALSLDLGGPTTESPSLGGSGSSDPLETKLALAEEFRAIGDADGARALVQEVISEASGSLKAKAERYLAEMT